MCLLLSACGLCRMEHCAGRSVHLTPSGLDFDEQRVQLVGFSALQLVAACSLCFPCKNSCY